MCARCQEKQRRFYRQNYNKKSSSTHYKWNDSRRRNRRKNKRSKSCVASEEIEIVKVYIFI